jgi:NADPH:quinone reductase-like Zn-dependent oxidoreductase
MKAVLYDRYGPPEVLYIADVPRPTVGPSDVLVRIQAVAVTRFDSATREVNRKDGPVTSALSRLISGVRAPRQRILGSEYAGQVEEIGSEVTAFTVGDRVFGSTGIRHGAFAEYLSAPESGLIANIPPDMDMDSAAALPDGGLNALWCLRQAGIAAGTRVLVYGAAGAIGSAGVQLAKVYGGHVTAVCSTG